MSKEQTEERFEFDYYIDDKYSTNLTFSSQSAITLDGLIHMFRAFCVALGYNNKEIEKYFGPK